MAGSRDRDRGLLGAVAVGAFAVVCCAAGPALLVALSGLGAALVGGIAGVVVVLIALGAAALWLRRRRSCAPPGPGAPR